MYTWVQSYHSWAWTWVCIWALYTESGRPEFYRFLSWQQPEHPCREAQIFPSRVQNIDQKQSLKSYKLTSPPVRGESFCAGFQSFVQSPTPWLLSACSHSPAQREKQKTCPRKPLKRQATVHNGTKTKTPPSNMFLQSLLSGESLLTSLKDDHKSFCLPQLTLSSRRKQWASNTSRHSVNNNKVCDVIILISHKH